MLGGAMSVLTENCFADGQFGWYEARSGNSLKHAVVRLCLSLNWKGGICDAWMISFNATY